MTGGFETDPFLSPSPTWYVMFTGVEKRKHLTDWLSPKAFQHVNAFFYDPRGSRWCIYDVNRGGVAIRALPSAEFDLWIASAKAQGARILKVDWAPVRRAPLQIGMWCVSAVRYAIGSRSRALRPIGFWRDLLREGAEEVFK